MVTRNNTSVSPTGLRRLEDNPHGLSSTGGRAGGRQAIELRPVQRNTGVGVVGLSCDTVVARLVRNTRRCQVVPGGCDRRAALVDDGDRLLEHRHRRVARVREARRSRVHDPLTADHVAVYSRNTDVVAGKDRVDRVQAHDRRLLIVVVSRAGCHAVKSEVRVGVLRRGHNKVVTPRDRSVRDVRHRRRVHPIRHGKRSAENLVRSAVFGVQFLCGPTTRVSVVPVQLGVSDDVRALGLRPDRRDLWVDREVLDANRHILA